MNFCCIFCQFLLLNCDSFLVFEVLEGQREDLRAQTGLGGWVGGCREIALPLKPEEVLVLFVFCPLSSVS